jgi:hypothetical protein
VAEVVRQAGHLSSQGVVRWGVWLWFVG